MEEIGMSRING